MKKGVLIFLLVFVGLRLTCCKASNNKQENFTENKSRAAIDSVLFHYKITDLFQDRDHNYWLGTEQGVLIRHDGNSYHHFNKIESGSIRHIQQDRYGKIWFGCGGKVYKIEEGAILEQQKEIGFPSPFMSKVTLHPEDVWFGDVNKKGVYHSGGNGLNYVSFEEVLGPEVIERGKFFIDGKTRVHNNEIWFGTIMNGVISYDGKDLKRIKNEDLDFQDKEEFLHVRSIYLDSKERLWIGNNGIGLLKREGNKITNFSKEQGYFVPMESFIKNSAPETWRTNTGLQAVFAIEEDKEGNMWFGDRDTGLWKYDGKKLSNLDGIYEGVEQGDLIWKIYADRDGHLFILLSSGKVVLHSEAGFTRLMSLAEMAEGKG